MRWKIASTHADTDTDTDLTTTTTRKEGRKRSTEAPRQTRSMDKSGRYKSSQMCIEERMSGTKGEDRARGRRREEGREGVPENGRPRQLSVHL